MNTLQFTLAVPMCLLGLMACSSSTPPSPSEGASSSPVTASPDRMSDPLKAVAAPMTAMAASPAPSALCPFLRPQDPHPQTALYRGKCMEGGLFASGKLDRGKIAEDTVDVHYSDDDPSARVSVKVAAAGLDEENVVEKVPLYTVTMTLENREVNLCARERYEGMNEKAIATPGYWRNGVWTAQHHGKDVFSLSCVTGAIAKCVHWGYVPWVRDHGARKASLAPYFQACVQAARAGYHVTVEGADDPPFTCAGTYIDMYDDLGIQKKRKRSLVFESLWGADGKVCIARARWQGCSDLLKLDEQGCKDPVAEIGKPWSATDARGLIAVASSPIGASEGCPAQRKGLACNY